MQATKLKTGDNGQGLVKDKYDIKAVAKHYIASKVLNANDILARFIAAPFSLKLNGQEWY
jgi:hypothetical protein